MSPFDSIQTRYIKDFRYDNLGEFEEEGTD
jgi:hypothetical protein